MAVFNLEEFRRLPKGDEPPATEETPLKTGGGGGTFGGMSEIDAKIAAAEARTDTKFAQLIGKIDVMNENLGQRITHVESQTAGMRSTVIGTGIAAVATIIAIMAYGAQWFGVGMDAQQVSSRAAESAITAFQPKIEAMAKRADNLDAKVDAVDAKFDTLINSLNDRLPPRSSPYATPKH